MTEYRRSLVEVGAQSIRWVLAGFVALLVVSISVAWLARLAFPAEQYITEMIPLDDHGVTGVSLSIAYPGYLRMQQTPRDPAVITVRARAVPEATGRALELILPLPDETTGFVDTSGVHMPGRLALLPGHPDAIPHDLRIAHENTQRTRGALRPRRVTVEPILRLEGQLVPLPELAFQIQVESTGSRLWRGLVYGLTGVGTPALLIALIVGAGVWGWRASELERRAERQRSLSTSYSRLREDIKLERWAEAREAIGQIVLLDPGYRDVDELDTMVSSAESAVWRREQLYRLGVGAYKRRDWPTAVQAFATIEGETPFYRDVRFLKRTAALCADLGSRDRSSRVRAARELGEIADLVDMTPLLYALGDNSAEVSQAAEESFKQIGTSSFEALLSGLSHPEAPVRARSYELLAGFGRSIREPLLGALRCADPRVTTQVARLLGALGARDELAGALLWAAPEHLEGIVQALISEGVAASGSLIDTLLRAPPERRQTVLNAIGALKSQADVTRRLEEAWRSAKNAREKVLLRRALNTSATTFRVVNDTGITAPESLMPAKEPPPEPEEPVRRLRLRLPRGR